jgi:xylem cysteine proteinase
MGCSGGLQHRVFNYIKAHGIALESQYPYTAKGGKCQYDPDTMRNFNISGHKFVNRWTKSPANRKERLMSALTEMPVSIALNAASKEFQFYKSGIFNG